ncbi:trigger factor [Actinoplanes sp. SE50]|uniref:trigger factor n=1 Tax=unclassified Actinoplanes TaxID=2626549 RepID=UPI00023ED565|nr:MULTISPECIES: trigger factor [unclassified Actinoplanes]AEV82249.1 trigger factor [Actinoplanes sp. SE50/110]ATO80647.1 trigger factor [Actinoplanes sp. SE50]SLL98054.1 trigger factor [Actinoplanes sp. SE50/110]
MKSTVETLSPTRVKLAIEVPFDELKPSLQKAYREIGAQVQVPGFRKGKVPSAVIDQRVGRGAVLNEAVQEAIPQQILAAVQEHDVKTLGRPEVEITEFADNAPLKFTAEVDVRPEIVVPDLSTISVEVPAVEIGDNEIDEQINGLRERFATLKTVERAAAEGDYVQLDLNATVDGEEVPGGSATNISHEVGSKQLLPGLDEVLVGLSAGDETTFTTQLVGGDFAGRDADVKVVVRTVKDKQLPEIDDDFAQLASEFDTLEELRGDLRERLTKVKKVEQIYAARDEALKQLVEAANIPAPEGVVKDEVEGRKQAMTDQLERIGATLADYLASEEKTEEQIDQELTEAAQEGVRIQLLLDTVADAEDVQVTDDEFGHEIVHRAQRAQMQPQQYYDQLVRSGAAAAVFGDVRRGKALASVMEQVTMKDSEGNTLTLDDLRAASEDEHAGHNH